MDAACFLVEHADDIRAAARYSARKHGVEFDDAHQEALIGVWRSLERLDDDRSVTGYIRVVVDRRVCDFARRTGPRTRQGLRREVLGGPECASEWSRPGHDVVAQLEAREDLRAAQALGVDVTRVGQSAAERSRFLDGVDVGRLLSVARELGGRREEVVERRLAGEKLSSIAARWGVGAARVCQLWREVACAAGSGRKGPGRPKRRRGARMAAIDIYDAVAALPPEGFCMQEAVDALEHCWIGQALARSNGSVTKAAKLLGMSRSTLSMRLKKRPPGGEAMNVVAAPGAETTVEDGRLVRAERRIKELELELTMLRMSWRDELREEPSIEALGMRPRLALWAAQDVGVPLEPETVHRVPAGHLGALMQAYERRMLAVDTCEACGEDRPIVARGRCRACYEKLRREEGRKP